MIITNFEELLRSHNKSKLVEYASKVVTVFSANPSPYTRVRLQIISNRQDKGLVN